MTAFDQFDPFERRITEAIDEIAVARTPVYLDDILRLTARSSQRRRWTTSERFRPMNRFSIAAVAALIAAALGGAVLLSGSKNPNVHAPVPTATPTVAPTSEPVAAFPGALWGGWVADAEPISGLTSQGPRIQAGFDWNGGRDFSVQTDYIHGYLAFQSDALASDPGEFRIRAQASVDGCSRGDVGTYAWTRSADGLFLAVTLVADPCARRALTLARTWVRTLGAANDGGSAMALLSDPYPDVQVTLARLSWAMDAIPPVDIHTYGSAPVQRDLVIYLNPKGFAKPCDLPVSSTFDIKTAAALGTYLKGLPAASAVTSQPTVIDGLAATHLTATLGDGCGGAEMSLFTQPSTPTSNGGTGVVTAAPGATLSLWVVVRNGELLLFWYSGDNLPAAEEQAVIGSIKFTNGLPKP